MFHAGVFCTACSLGRCIFALGDFWCGHLSSGSAAATLRISLMCRSLADEASFSSKEIKENGNYSDDFLHSRVSAKEDHCSSCILSGQLKVQLGLQAF